MSGIVLRHLTFTGSGLMPASLDFTQGVNVIYGASNTGKSFSSKALNFMFGGAQPLPGIEERVGYEEVWLGLMLPTGREVTVYRAAGGGAYRVYDGLVTSKPAAQEGTLLQPVHDPKRDDSLSRYLLDSLGLDGKLVVKNMNGEKESLTLRSLTPFMFVSEELIISERSPVLSSGQVIRETAEKNILKVLLTGRDDSAVVASQKPNDRKVARQAQIDLVDELIAQVAERLGDNPPSRDDLQDQSDRLSESIGSLQADLRAHQNKIDELVSKRRSLLDTKGNTEARLLELEVTLGRFDRLMAIYASDIERLEALEEGGFLLLAISGQPCPVCGADPGAQQHSHGTEEIERSHKAAAAEVRKIETERRELRATSESLSAEAEGLRARFKEIASKLLEAETALDAARPKEAQTRQRYEMFALQRSMVENQLELYDQCARLEAKRAQLDVKRSPSTKGEKLTVGIDGSTAFAFSETIQTVLRAWNFPDAEKARFDLALQDIEISGKPRAANGKGVRAILNAAFKVSTLIYCRENELPHPGFIVLDTPLLTYREPLVQAKYGDLEPDEIAIRDTGLADHFYRHLASLKDIGQFVILENADPPAAVRPELHVETFTGRSSVGRLGFFPPMGQVLSLAA